MAAAARRGSAAGEAGDAVAEAGDVVAEAWDAAAGAGHGPAGAGGAEAGESREALCEERRAAEAGPVRLPNGCQARAVLERVGDKWSLYAIFALGDGPRRFTELKRSIDGVSQRMLTVTLRGLERDGIVTRTVYPVIPPRVEYALTPMGRTLLDAVGALIAWADSHLAEIEAARQDYDRRMGREP